MIIKELLDGNSLIVLKDVVSSEGRKRPDCVRNLNIKDMQSMSIWRLPDLRRGLMSTEKTQNWEGMTYDEIIVDCCIGYDCTADEC